MVFFISAGLLSTLFALLSHYGKNQRLIYLSLFIIFYIIAFQDAIACDFPAYLDYYEGVLSGTSEATLYRTKDNIDKLEIGWYYLNFLLGKAFHTFYAITVVIAFFYCYTLYQLLKRIPSQWHWVAIIYFYFQPMLFFMSGLRQSVAICCFVLANLQLYDKGYLKALVLLLLGFTFHNSILYGLLFVPLYYLFNSKLVEKANKVFSVVLIAIFTIALMNLSRIQSYITSTFVEVVESYTDTYTGYLEEMEGSSYTMLNILSKVFVFVFSVVAFTKCRDDYRWILGLSIVAQIGSNLFGYQGSIQRVMLYVSLFTVPAYAMIPFYIKSKEFKWMFVLFVCFIAIRTFINSLTNLQFINYQNYHTVFNVF